MKHWNWSDCYVCHADHCFEYKVKIIAWNKRLDDHKHSNRTKVGERVKLMSFCSVFFVTWRYCSTLVGLHLFLSGPKRHSLGYTWFLNSSRCLPRIPIGWSLVTPLAQDFVQEEEETKILGETWRHLAVVSQGRTQVPRSRMSYSSANLVFFVASLFSKSCIPSWYLGCWEQPGWFGVGGFGLWSLALHWNWSSDNGWNGKDIVGEWHILRNGDRDIISIHFHCPNRGIISIIRKIRKQKGYSHINGPDTLAQGILDLRVYTSWHRKSGKLM